MRECCARSVVALALLAGCAGTMQREFDSRGWHYPVHIARQARVVEVGFRPSMEAKNGACRAAPEYQPFLEAALQHLPESKLLALGRDACAGATAVSFADPFVLPEAGDPRLALKTYCFYAGKHAFSRSRYPEELDGWEATVTDSYWLKYNIAVFEATPQGTRFAYFIQSLEDLQAGIIPEHVNPLEGFIGCGAP